MSQFAECGPRQLYSSFYFVCRSCVAELESEVYKVWCHLQVLAVNVNLMWSGSVSHYIRLLSVYLKSDPGTDMSSILRQKQLLYKRQILLITCFIERTTATPHTTLSTLTNLNLTVLNITIIITLHQ